MMLRSYLRSKIMIVRFHDRLDGKFIPNEFHPKNTLKHWFRNINLRYFRIFWLFPEYYRIKIRKYRLSGNFKFLFPIPNFKKSDESICWRMSVTVDIGDKFIGVLKFISQTISAVCKRANVCQCWIEWFHFNCFTRQEILKINDWWSAWSRSLIFWESFSMRWPHL